LPTSGFEHDPIDAERRRFVLETVEDGGPELVAPCVRRDVHALDLGDPPAGAIDVPVDGPDPVALPSSVCNRQTKPGDASPSALMRSRLSLKSAIDGSSMGASRVAMLSWAMW
jgi:hypothetical protein